MVPEFCTRRMLVMDFVDGVKFARLDSPEMQGVDRRRIAAIVTHAMARQIFLHRLFHADPSPGNILILPPDRVAFLDFGAVGAVYFLVLGKRFPLRFAEWAFCRICLAASAGARTVTVRSTDAEAAIQSASTSRRRSSASPAAPSVHPRAGSTRQGPRPPRPRRRAIGGATGRPQPLTR